MKSVAYAYANKRECSIPECVYHIFKWLVVEKNIPWCYIPWKLPTVIFLKRKTKKRCRIFPSEEQISELPQESTNIFRINMAGRYIDRLYVSFSGGKYSALNNFCYAEYWDIIVTSNTVSDNEKAGKMAIQCDKVARQNCLVPIEKVEASFHSELQGWSTPLFWGNTPSFLSILLFLKKIYKVTPLSLRVIQFGKCKLYEAL